ncbi:MAG: carboxypeptidase-like regulatory domain-containing protein [Acidobacteria bacterium]|nr:carboxypeptidase-like regulatory domain-containing protein [Acidobacteriota bacterium]
MLLLVVLAATDVSRPDVAAVPQRIPGQSVRPASIQGVVRDETGRAVPGVEVAIRNPERRAITNADGVFRFLDVRPGEYQLTLTREGFTPLSQAGLRIGRAAFVTVELTMKRLASTGAAPKPLEPETPSSPYGRRPARRGEPPSEAVPLPPDEHVYLPIPDRWNLAMPDWDRYGVRGDYPYVSGKWWDPYNTNRLKGDYPVFGKRTFFTFTGVSDSLIEGRNLPVASAVSAARPLSEPFFGRGGQQFPVTVIRTSFDLFRGDTVFRPVDWRIRVQPAISVNYINTAEWGVVNMDVRRGSNRLSTHLGLQEAFAEVKIADLSDHYDFLSVRAGIQEFSSDFRGFLAVLESPGIRFFGTLASNRIEYNAAFFDLLEKETNSGFNEWKRRKQQVWIGSVYIQDFLTPGYTTQFSVHGSRDEGELHYDRNGFLVRPAPIGVIEASEVHSYYLGWTGNGHIGRLNISHAFYQALGHESANAIAAQRVDINAQMAAASCARSGTSASCGSRGPSRWSRCCFRKRCARTSDSTTAPAHSTGRRCRTTSCSSAASRPSSSARA